MSGDLSRTLTFDAKQQALRASQHYVQINSKKGKMVFPSGFAVRRYRGQEKQCAARNGCLQYSFICGRRRRIPECLWSTILEIAYRALIDNDVIRKVSTTDNGRVSAMHLH
jgi:hypothetical protein